MNKFIYHYHVNGSEPPILEHNPWILVFGSNLSGIHGAGAAKLAAEYYGARRGVGFGQEARSFAWPTKGEYKDNKLPTLPLTKIQHYANLMRTYMEHRITNAHQRYWFTAVGTGLAGYSHAEIAPMVKDLGMLKAQPSGLTLSEHISFPIEWREYIEPIAHHNAAIEDQLFIPSADLKSAEDRGQPVT